MREEEAEAKEVMVIGFEVEGEELGPWFRQAAELVNKYAEEGQAIDFAKVERGEGGLSQFFVEKVSPFYLRPIIRNENGEEVVQPRAVPVNGKDEQQPSEEYSEAVFFGRLKRIFNCSK